MWYRFHVCVPFSIFRCSRDPHPKLGCASVFAHTHTPMIRATSRVIKNQLSTNPPMRCEGTYYKGPDAAFFGRRLAFGQKITYYRTHLGVEAAFCLENLDAIGNCVEAKNTPDAFVPINKSNYFS